MENDQYEKWLRLAEQVAGDAQKIAQREFRQTEFERKPDGSHVTRADVEIQHRFCAAVRKNCPDHAVLGEEDVTAQTDAPAPHEARYCWIIDPLDGTRNYVRGYPCFSVSIALLEDARPVVGVIRDLVTEQSYAAIRGQGARSNGRSIHIAEKPVDPKPMITFQPADDGTTYEGSLGWLREVRIRNAGSTAIHLAYVADGNVDAAYCIECKVWDIAAGSLLIEEAGGVITGLDGESLFPFQFGQDPRRKVPFLAGSPSTHAWLLAAMRG